MNHRTAVVFCCLVGVLCFVRVVSAQTRKVEVKADTLKIESEHKTARFVGNVRAVFGNLRFFCEKMTVVYSDDGAIVSLKAVGHVTVMKDGAKATAGRAEMNIGTQQIVLTGNPQLTRDGNVLRGQAIEVHIRTGKIEVREAVGTFTIPAGTGR